MTNPIFEQIQKDIDANDIVLFMKGTKDFPMCGFSAKVAQILQLSGADFKDINVLEDDEIREGIKAFTDWPTIPQLYVKGEFVGGCDIIQEMYENDELTTLFKEKGITA